MVKPETDSGFESVLSYVEEELGFATSHYNDSYLDRRVTARQRRTDAEGYREYLEVLARDPDEQAALLDALSINVTGFFRNPDMWEHLRELLREIADRRGRVRAWSAPCSDGREPYSLAMLALDDPEVDADSVEITGTDISEEALETARRGVYETTATTDIDDELSALEGYEQYVERDDDCFEVTDAVRELVSFRRHDLIDGPPLGPFDLVLCRNLLIYIDGAYEEPILSTLRESLAEGGYLAVGMTESLGNTADAFETVDASVRIHRKVE